MTPTLDKRQISLKEQMVDLESKLRSIEFAIGMAEKILSAKPDSQPTLNRYNILCHNRSETMTKIRRLKERMK